MKMVLEPGKLYSLKSLGVDLKTVVYKVKVEEVGFIGEIHDAKSRELIYQISCDLCDDTGGIWVTYRHNEEDIKVLSIDSFMSRLVGLNLVYICDMDDLHTYLTTQDGSSIGFSIHKKLIQLGYMDSICVGDKEIFFNTTIPESVHNNIHLNSDDVEEFLISKGYNIEHIDIYSDMVK